MAKVMFSFRQRATVTIETAAEVPDDVVSMGDEAIVDWLRHNEHLWNGVEPEETTDMDYAETIDGPYYVDYVEEKE